MPFPLAHGISAVSREELKFTAIGRYKNNILIIVIVINNMLSNNDKDNSTVFLNAQRPNLDMDKGKCAIRTE